MIRIKLTPLGRYYVALAVHVLAILALLLASLVAALDGALLPTLGDLVFAALITGSLFVLEHRETKRRWDLL